MELNINYRRSENLIRRIFAETGETPTTLVAFPLSSDALTPEERADWPFIKTVQGYHVPDTLRMRVLRDGAEVAWEAAEEYEDGLAAYRAWRAARAASLAEARRPRAWMTALVRWLRRRSERRAEDAACA